MAHRDKLTVSVPPLRQGGESLIVQMLEDTAAYGRRTFDSPLDKCYDLGEPDWSLIRAHPSRYLCWLSQTEFGQVDAKHDESGRLLPGFRQVGFAPHQSKLRRLDSLRVAQHSPLPITLLMEPMAGAFQFEDGRHRAYWLAINDAEFVPLMVPMHQADRFRDRFEQS